MNQIQRLSLKRFNNAWLAMTPSDRISTRLIRNTEANQQIREERFRPSGGVEDIILGMMPDPYPQSERLVDFCHGLLFEICLLDRRVRELEGKQ